MPLPQLPGSAPSSGCPLPSPASPFQSKGYQWKQQESAGRWGEKHGPQPPPGLLPDPHRGTGGREALRDGECMSDPRKVGALRMLPASKHRARGDQDPYPGAAAAPRTLGQKQPPLREQELPQTGAGWGGVHPCIWALAAFGTAPPPPPGVESPWADSGGSPLPAVLPAPVPVPQLASVGGEFLPLSFLAPIGRCHLGSVGRQARRWPWGGRW